MLIGGLLLLLAGYWASDGSDAADGSHRPLHSSSELSAKLGTSVSLPNL